jgi:transcriptional regulator with XRE-family HTH domain
MPYEEQAICRRLRAFRFLTDLSQAQFAILSGLNARAYAGFEYERNQLNYHAAWKIFSFFKVLNPLWLADGNGPILEARDFEFPTSKSLGIGKRALFSDVFARLARNDFLKARVLRMSGQYLPVRIFFFDSTALGRLNNKERFGDLVSGWLAELPAEKVEPFLDELFLRGAQIFARYPRESDAGSAESLKEAMMEIENRRRSTGDDGSAKKDLTDGSLKSKTSGVKSELEKLIARVKRLASKPGAKSALARFLDVAPARVTEWLNDDPAMRKEPGGHYTLALLKWVEQQERQK